MHYTQYTLKVLQLLVLSEVLEVRLNSFKNLGVLNKLMDLDFETSNFSARLGEIFFVLFSSPLYSVLKVVVPIGYLLCFLAAYYGPNAAYLGNIGSSHWQYTRS